MSTPTIGDPPGAAQVAADTDDLLHFADRGQRYLVALSELHERVGAERRRAVAVLGGGSPPDRATSAVEALIGRAAEVNERVRSVARSLLEASAEGCRPALRRAIVDRRLPPPTDPIRDRVLAAVQAGLGPADADLDAAYFPAPYVRSLELGRRIDQLEAERERADGSSLAWWDDDDRALARIDEELDRLRIHRRALAEHGLDPDGAIDELEAMALVAEATAGEPWEGAGYAAAFARHHEDRISDGGPFGLGSGAVERPRGFADELDHVAERVGTDVEVAVAFYRGLGPALTADLPTFVVGADGPGDVEADTATLARFSAGLGAASRSVDQAGRVRLPFGGGDLLRQPRRPTQPGVVGYSPALLFVDGAFDGRFLADATVAALELAHRGDRRGLEAHGGWEAVGLLGGRVGFDGGEEPRNILLARAGERSEVVRLVLDGLVGPDGSGKPTSDGLDPLLRPSRPFVPATGPDPDRGHWLDRLSGWGNVEDPDHPALSAVAYPELADPYPITGFLAAATADDESSRRIVHAVASSVASDGPSVGDPGTAAGLDLLLAGHATVMIRAEALAALGLERSPLNAATDDPVRAHHWKAVHGEVLRWGRGHALADSLEILLDRAVRGAVGRDGWVDIDAFAPVAHAAGRSRAEAHDALADYAATLDDDARNRNRWANRSSTVTTTAVGLLPGGGLVAAPAGLGWTWFFDGYPDDHEIAVRREQWEEEYDADDPFLWKKVAAATFIELGLGPDGTAPVEIVVPGLGPRVVPIRPTVDPLRFEWRHPDTDRWLPLPPIDEGAHHVVPHHDPPRIRQVVSAADEVAENYRDGIEARAWPNGRVGRVHGPVPEPLRDAGWTGKWLGRP